MMSELKEGDRVRAVWFSLDEGLRIWPIWTPDGHPSGWWRVVRVEGTGPDATITEIARGENGHNLEAEHGAKWGINDNETVPPGTEGTVGVLFGTSDRQVSVAWDNGSSIMLTRLDLWEKV
jgi:hypothetical protein